MSNDLPIDHPNKDFDDWFDEGIDLVDEGRKPSPDAANPPSGDALDDILLELYLGQGFVKKYTTDVRQKQLANPQLSKAKAALQDLFYTEVLELIGEDVEPNVAPGLLHDVQVRQNALRQQLRAKAKAKWGQP